MMPLIRASGISQESATSMLASVNSAEAKILLVRNVVDNSPLNRDDVESIKASLKKLTALCAERNSLMHHLWASSADGSVNTIDYRKILGAEGRVKPQSAEGIVDLINRTIDAAFGICSAAKSTWMTPESSAALKIGIKDK